VGGVSGDGDAHMDGGEEVRDNGGDSESSGTVCADPNKDKDDSACCAAVATESDELAKQLATRGANPRIFMAALWFPGTHAAFAAAQASDDGPAPIEPAADRGNTPVGVDPSHSPGTAAMTAASSWQPSAFASQPPASATLEGESSDEMDHDQLVMAYVTTPASLAPMATPTSPPIRTRPSSGTRRRANNSGTARAAAAVAPHDSADAGARVQQSGVKLRDVLDAGRNGLSSVRREVTRLRAEVVIVNFQAASTLPHMDGHSAATEGRVSRAGIIFGRLEELEQAVRGLATHISSSSNAAAGGQDGAKDSLAFMTEIKISSITFGLLMSLLWASRSRLAVHIEVSKHGIIIVCLVRVTFCLLTSVFDHVCLTVGSVSASSPGHRSNS